MNGDKFVHSRSESHVCPARLKRLITSWIRYQPVLSGFMIFACAVLMIVKFSHLDTYNSFQIAEKTLDISTKLHYQIQCYSMLISVEQSAEEAEKTAAISELVQKTRSYKTNSTKVALVMSKTRSDDLRWLRDYLQTQQVKPIGCRKSY